jgi:glycosyltransferase involved in cell wall biosynthesis
MQPKVSMVIPCYNKRDYIGEMFDSIIAQEWDNIELILVNDGSTDGTRAVIAEYEPRFRARGYTPVIIDQENAGVCAAARAGLSRITGEYVCQVDADDELDPAYVSTMAGWLETHKEYDYCACDRIYYTGRGQDKVFRPFAPVPIEESCDCLTELFLLGFITATVWVYLVRSEYLNKCRIVETYYTENRGSHEPSFAIPLTAFGGKIKYFRLPLYRFNFGGDGMSRFDDFDKALKYYDNYDMLCNAAINALPEFVRDDAQKQKLIDIAAFSRLKHLVAYQNLPFGEFHKNRLKTEFVEFCKNKWNICEDLLKEYNCDETAYLFSALAHLLIGKTLEVKTAKPPGRVIACGAKGKNAQALLPSLCRSQFVPTVLWDETVSEEGTEIHGIPLNLPDFKNLTETDTLLILPSKGDAVDEMRRKIAGKDIFQILYYSDIARYLTSFLFADSSYDLGTSPE